MSIINVKPEKILKSGWSYFVDDYAISGGWSFNGKALIVCDAAGGVYVFNGQSGDCLLYTSPSPRDGLLSRMPSSA